MRLRATLLAAVALLAGCASGGSSSSPGSPSSSPSSSRSDDAPALATAAIPATGIQAGWMELRGGRSGRVTSLTLVSANSRNGQLISRGLARMDGGKVIDDGTAADVAAYFEKVGFDRFAVKAKPEEGPSGAIGAVWIDRGRGIETLFLLPGARQSDRTKDLPDVYEAIKTSIFEVHQATPGSMVTSGQGWAGETMTNQKVEKPKR